MPDVRFMTKSFRRYAALGLLVSSALLCPSCSYINNFIIINASQVALEVSYRVKPPHYSGAPTRLSDRAPETLPVSELGKEVAWQPLRASRYKIQRENRIVVLTLNPDEAVLLTQCRPANDQRSGDCEPDGFSIVEVGLVGADGEINLKGEQVHKSFVRNRNTYTLTYY
jgi:hypothetical protein